VDARRIGRELGVRHLVEGSVRRAGSRVRITAQLIDAENGRHLWAQRYDRDVGDIFAVQDDVVQQIATALSRTLGTTDLTPLPSEHPRNLVAHEHVMRGRRNILLAQGRAEAKAEFEKAIELDPLLSEAHAWLAVYYYTDWFLYHREPERESLAAAFAAADNAIETGPNNSLAHMALGMVSLYAGRRAIALQSLHRALELNPNEADAHCLIQDAYTFEGEFEKGAESVRTAMRLNPHYPEWYLWHLGFALYCCRDYEGVVRELSKVKESAEPLRILAAAHARLGQIDEARAVAKRFLSVFPDFSSAGWGRTQPFRNRNDLEHCLEGYRLAGLPD
jgi:adenylate cyclase